MVRLSPGEWRAPGTWPRDPPLKTLRGRYSLRRQPRASRSVAAESAVLRVERPPTAIHLDEDVRRAHALLRSPATESKKVRMAVPPRIVTDCPEGCDFSHASTLRRCSSEPRLAGGMRHDRGLAACATVGTDRTVLGQQHGIEPGGVAVELGVHPVPVERNHLRLAAGRLRRGRAARLRSPPPAPRRPAPARQEPSNLSDRSAACACRPPRPRRDRPWPQAARRWRAPHRIGDKRAGRG